MQIEAQALPVADLSPDEVLAALHTTPPGLSAAAVAQRLQQYGFNELEEKQASAWLKFLGFFWGPIPWMIEVASSWRRSSTIGRPLALSWPCCC